MPLVKVLRFLNNCIKHWFGQLTCKSILLAWVIAPINNLMMPSGANFEDFNRAQNRTTHAARAFVRFLFIQLTGITLAFFRWNISLAFLDEQAVTNMEISALAMLFSILWLTLSGS